VRIERVVLEHHGDVALLRVDGVDHPTADRDRSRSDVLEPGDQPEQRGLAAARRTDEHNELPVLDRHAHAVQDLHIAERFAHIANVDRRHGVASSLARDSISRRF
jgi:hypothetical protein